nr:hypothetical protein [Tanacetum cinerariifolium]
MFLIRVKELTGWAPSFNDDSDSDDESVDSQEASILKDKFSNKNSDMKEIPKTTKVLDKEPGAKASFQEDVNVSGCSRHFQSVKAPKSGGSILHII